MFSIFWPIRLVAFLVRFIFSLLVTASCVLTLAAFMGDRSWAWSLATHFRAQYLALQIVALAGVSLGWLMARKRGGMAIEKWLTLIALMFFAGMNLVCIMPYYVPPSEVADEAPSYHLKLLHMNLFGTYNPRKQDVVTLIRKEKPDVIDLVEYTPDWQHSLEASGVFARYPYRLARAHMGLYSRLPLTNAHLSFTDPRQKTATYANIIAQVTLDRKPVTILVAHPASPYLPMRLVWQRESFDAWVRERRKIIGRPFILVGDLNTSPWSPEFKGLIQATGLRDSQLGFGLQPSWPMFLPFPRMPHERNVWATPFGIPIDHVLVSNQISVFARHTGPFVGSDHLPVVIELGLKGAKD